MKKVKVDVDIPLVAYSSYEATISTGQSESQPEFSVVDIVGDWSYLEQLAEVMDYE